MMDWFNQDNVVLLAAMITGGVVLLSTLITVVSQVITGIFQRRQERTLKTFETRMQLYVQLCTQYQEIGDLQNDVAEVKLKEGESWRKWRDKRVEAQIVQNQVKSGIRTGSVLSESALTEHAKVLDEHAAKVLDELERLTREYDHINKELDATDENLRELMIRVAATGAGISLIAGPRVSKALRTLTCKIKEGGKYDDEYLTEFLLAARKELKIVD